MQKGDVLLDIGLSLASHDCIGMLLECKSQYSVTLEAADIIKPETVKTRYPTEWLAGILDVPITIGDIRTMKLPKERYDVVTCISTIEHIGYDAPSSTVEGSAFERKRSKEAVNKARDPHVNSKVLDAFHKALKKGGTSVTLQRIPEGSKTIKIKI